MSGAFCDASSATAGMSKRTRAVGAFTAMAMAGHPAGSRRERTLDPARQLPAIQEQPTPALRSSVSGRGTRTAESLASPARRKMSSEDVLQRFTTTPPLDHLADEIGLGLGQ